MPLVTLLVCRFSCCCALCSACFAAESWAAACALVGLLLGRALALQRGGALLDLLLERAHLAFPVFVLLLVVFGERAVALNALPAAGQRRPVKLALQVREPGLLVAACADASCFCQPMIVGSVDGLIAAPPVAASSVSLADRGLILLDREVHRIVRQVLEVSAPLRGLHELDLVVDLRLEDLQHERRRDHEAQQHRHHEARHGHDQVIEAVPLPVHGHHEEPVEAHDRHAPQQREDHRQPTAAPSAR